VPRPNACREIASYPLRSIMNCCSPVFPPTPPVWPCPSPYPPLILGAEVVVVGIIFRAISLWVNGAIVELEDVALPLEGTGDGPFPALRFLLRRQHQIQIEKSAIAKSPRPTPIPVLTSFVKMVGLVFSRLFENDCEPADVDEESVGSASS